MYTLAQQLFLSTLSKATNFVCSLISIILITNNAFCLEPSFKTQLWAPDQPVDILIYNPNNRPIDLPQPYTPETIPEVYGQEIEESQREAFSQDMDYRKTEIVTAVGNNVSFSITFNDDESEGFFDRNLGRARRDAFRFAANIWAQNLQGPAEISVQATMTPHGGDQFSAVLASAAPGQFWRNFKNAPMRDVQYPECLVEIISGMDPDAKTFEINVDFNSDVDEDDVLGTRGYYYGTDGSNGTDFDFVTITLHELTHGLGFCGSFNSDGSHGYSGYKLIYDHFLVNTSGKLLTTLSPSPTNVTGNNVFWNGLLGLYAFDNDFGGTGRLPLFSPTPWDSGSSISHLDETTFAGDWELMTPHNDGDVVHELDAIVLGILQDIGHSLPRSCYVNTNATGFEDGSCANPFNSVSEALLRVPANGLVRIFPGTYKEKLTIKKSVELRSCGGIATIRAD